MEPIADYSGLSALFLNCTLKRRPRPSHTEGLIEQSRLLMERQGVQTGVCRPVEYELPVGVMPDMREHGYERDDWPGLMERILAADILVLATPIWLGEKSSVCQKVIERLYAYSGQRNDKGQYLYYGKVGGTLITGNEDGIKHCAMGILYALQHIGYTIPPQADAGWIGEAGPGPSYMDEGSGGPENDFTNRNTAFMSWNLLHMARLLKGSGGLAAFGNQPEAWKEGERFGYPELYRK